jgi:hypothetical protein
MKGRGGESERDEPVYSGNSDFCTALAIARFLPRRIRGVGAGGMLSVCLPLGS